mmetsp:Transcript_4838/g.7759  ORF Transcript_4838/g.7759 Transcript_4838/m.7759 type:complete len:209 (+) Transcript_4838:910-1536(+)
MEEEVRGPEVHGVEREGHRQVEEKGMVEQEESVTLSVHSQYSVEDTTKAAGSDDSGSHRGQQEAALRGIVKAQESGTSDFSGVYPESSVDSSGRGQGPRLSELSSSSATAIAALNSGKHLAEWSEEEVLVWLQHIELEMYASTLLEHSIDGMDLNQLVAEGVSMESADSSLTAWGIPNKYHRKRFLKKLHQLYASYRQYRQSSPFADP